MKNLSLAFLAAVSLVSIAGCPKKHKDDAGEAIAKMTSIKDEMCKCADKPCADKVNEEMAKWGQEQAKTASADKPAKLSEDETKKLAAVTEELTRCMTKAMTGMAPVVDKPAGDKPADPAVPPPANGSAAPASDKPADPAAGSAAGSAAAPAGSAAGAH